MVVEHIFIPKKKHDRLTAASIENEFSISSVLELEEPEAVPVFAEAFQRFFARHHSERPVVMGSNEMPRSGGKSVRFQGESEPLRLKIQGHGSQLAIHLKT